MAERQRRVSVTVRPSGMRAQCNLPERQEECGTEDGTDDDGVPLDEASVSGAEEVEALEEEQAEHRDGSLAVAGSLWTPKR